MKTTFFTLALIPVAYAAQGIKLWNQNQCGMSLDKRRIYVTVDNDNGCDDACNRRGRHAFFDVANWEDGANNARFTDPRAGDDAWLNIRPESDSTWGVYRENGDNTRIGWCQKTNDVTCDCGTDTVNNANAFAYCDMYQ